MNKQQSRERQITSMFLPQRLFRCVHEITKSQTQAEENFILFYWLNMHPNRLRVLLYRKNINLMPRYIPFPPLTLSYLSVSQL